MKERLLDVIKWGLILIIAGCVYYVVCPRYKYEFKSDAQFKCNKITGDVNCFNPKTMKWVTLGGKVDKALNVPQEP